VNTFNGGFVTMSRFMYAVAREGKPPRALTRLNDRAVPVVPVWFLGISSLVLAVVVALTGSWVIVVFGLRRPGDDDLRRCRVRGLAAAGHPGRRQAAVPPGRRPRLGAGRHRHLRPLLGLVSSVTVGKHTSAAPLVFLAVVGALVTIYVFTYLPRLERRNAEVLATRWVGGAAARAAARSEQLPDET
jgi:hypothetical protein